MSKPSQPALPPGLYERVMTGIDEARRRRATHRFAGSAALLASLLPAMAWLIRSFWLQAMQSGFGQYLSLIRSDFAQVLVNWQDFSLSLLESFPILPAIEILSAAFLMLVLMQATSKYRSHFLV